MQPVYDPTDPFEELARGVIRISFVLRQDLASVFDGLTDVPRELIRIIVRSPGLTLAELAETTHKQRSNTSAAVAELERHGLIQRHPHETDKRSVRIHPTAKARNAIRNIYRHWANQLQDWTGSLDPPSQQALLRAIPVLKPLTDIAEHGHHHHNTDDDDATPALRDPPAVV